MPKVIVINGSGQSGKDTFMDLCMELDHNILKISTIDFVKQVARYAGWDGVKDDEGRKFLSDLKDAMETYEDIPNRVVEQFIQGHPDNIIFVSAREPDNIEYYIKQYNALAVLVINPRVKPIVTNHADSEVFNYGYDLIIENTGTLEEYREMAKFFLDNLDDLWYNRNIE